MIVTRWLGSFFYLHLSIRNKQKYMRLRVQCSVPYTSTHGSAFEHYKNAHLAYCVLGPLEISTNQLFCVHSYYNNSKQYWWIYVFLIVLNDLKWNNKFYHMQHILWSALFTSNGSTHYHIHHKMDERKLNIIRGYTSGRKTSIIIITGYTPDLTIPDDIWSHNFFIYS